MTEGCQHNHANEHAHQHDHAPLTGTAWRLQLTMGLVLLYFLAELLGGWWTNSLALLADAGHMFSDLTALGISLFAAWLRRQPAAGQRTFGYQRVEILAALTNGALLLLVAGGIVHESWDRLLHPGHVLAGPMLLIAVGGLIVNLLSLFLLHGGHNHDLNMRGAWLHVLGDTLGSVAVIVAAALVWVWGWTWADPVASLLVCLIVVYSAWQLVREALEILMEHAPADIRVAQVRQLLLGVPGVHDVHCLHVWTISSGLKAISVHVVLDAEGTAPPTLDNLHQLLLDNFPVQHLTLQLEPQEFSHCTTPVGCPLESPAQGLRSDA